MIRAQDPTVVFIAETWLDEARLRLLLKNVVLEQMHVVSKVTQGGGLALLWKTDFNMSVDSSSLNHIDVVVNAGKENSWRFTGFYDWPETHKHHESWELLRQLNQKFTLPWLCVGDFNEILKSHEKKGGRLRPENQMRDFREALDECGFADLGYVEQKYTWYKQLTGGVTVWERLDRAVANNDWISLYPGTMVKHLECGFSDHKPIIIHLEGIPIRKQKPWRFEQVWLKEDECRAVVESAWQESLSSTSPMGVIETNLETCQARLRSWSKDSFGNITRDLIHKRKQLKEVEEEAIREGGANRVYLIKSELRELLVKEEELWQQHSKLHWLQNGDQNTRYFHGKASQRFRRNSIKSI